MKFQEKKPSELILIGKTGWATCHCIHSQNNAAVNSIMFNQHIAKTARKLIEHIIPPPSPRSIPQHQMINYGSP